MRRLRFSAVLLGLAVSFDHAATPLYLSADVSTTETATSSTFLPNQIASYVGAPTTYAVVLSLPGDATVDAIEKLDKSGSWLFSLGTANNLGGALGGADADPRDVIRFDGATSTYSLFFCGASVGVPSGANVDSLYLNGGDAGALVIGFDTPTVVGGSSFDASDLVRFDRTGPGCGDWILSATNPEFDASAAGIGITPSENVTSADRSGARILLTFDAPVDLGPPGVTTYAPGQIVQWDGTSFSPFEDVVGWPAGSVIEGLSSLANPGRIPPTLRASKVPASSAIVITWSTSCSEGGQTYGIYEGKIGTWYSHTLKTCNDTGTHFSEQIVPAPGDRYYLVVPRNALDEGSYGTSRNYPVGLNTERPAGTVRCAPTQVIAACPP